EDAKSRSAALERDLKDALSRLTDQAEEARRAEDLAQRLAAAQGGRDRLEGEAYDRSRQLETLRARLAESGKSHEQAIARGADANSELERAFARDRALWETERRALAAAADDAREAKRGAAAEVKSLTARLAEAGASVAERDRFREEAEGLRREFDDHR